MNQWISDYLKTQKAALDSIPVEATQQLIQLLRGAPGGTRNFRLRQRRQRGDFIAFRDRSREGRFG